MNERIHDLAKPLELSEVADFDAALNFVRVNPSEQAALAAEFDALQDLRFDLYVGGTDEHHAERPEWFRLQVDLDDGRPADPGFAATVSDEAIEGLIRAFTHGAIDPAGMSGKHLLRLAQAGIPFAKPSLPLTDITDSVLGGDFRYSNITFDESYIGDLSEAVEDMEPESAARLIIEYIARSGRPLEGLEFFYRHAPVFVEAMTPQMAATIRDHAKPVTVMSVDGLYEWIAELGNQELRPHDWFRWEGDANTRALLTALFASGPLNAVAAIDYVDASALHASYGWDSAWRTWLPLRTRTTPDHLKVLTHLIANRDEAQARFIVELMPSPAKLTDDELDALVKAAAGCVHLLPLLGTRWHHPLPSKLLTGLRDAMLDGSYAQSQSDPFHRAVLASADLVTRGESIEDAAAKLLARHAAGGSVAPTGASLPPSLVAQLEATVHLGNLNETQARLAGEWLSYLEVASFRLAALKHGRLRPAGEQALALVLKEAGPLTRRAILEAAAAPCPRDEFTFPGETVRQAAARLADAELQAR